MTCNDGFVISGPSTVTCTAGKLSQLPTCQPGYFYNYLSFIFPPLQLDYNANTLGTTYKSSEDSPRYPMGSPSQAIDQKT